MTARVVPVAAAACILELEGPGRRALLLGSRASRVVVGRLSALGFDYLLGYSLFANFEFRYPMAVRKREDQSRTPECVLITSHSVVSLHRARPLENLRSFCIELYRVLAS